MASREQQALKEALTAVDAAKKSVTEADNALKKAQDALTRAIVGKPTQASGSVEKQSQAQPNRVSSTIVEIDDPDNQLQKSSKKVRFETLDASERAHGHAGGKTSTDKRESHSPTDSTLNDRYKIKTDAGYWHAFTRGRNGGINFDMSSDALCLRIRQGWCVSNGYKPDDALKGKGPAPDVLRKTWSDMRSDSVGHWNSAAFQSWERNQAGK